MPPRLQIYKQLKPSSKSNGGSSPMEVVARGAQYLTSSIGPIEPQDLTIGLMAISKVPVVIEAGCWGSLLSGGR